MRTSVCVFFFWGGCRFLDFVHTLLDNLIANPEEELASCASRAYETTLAPRHGWILRNTIYVGFTPHRLRSSSAISPTLANGP